MWALACVLGSDADGWERVPGEPLIKESDKPCSSIAHDHTAPARRSSARNLCALGAI